MQGWYWWEHFEWNLGVKEMNRNRKLQLGQEKRGDEQKQKKKKESNVSAKEKETWWGSTTFNTKRARKTWR